MGLAVLINQSLKIKFLWLSWQPLTAQKSVGVPTHAGGFLLIEKFFGEAQARAGREFPSPRPPFLPAPPERIFRNQRRGFLGKKSELFPINTILDDFVRPRPSLRSGLGLRRAENIKTKIFKLSV